MPSETFDLKEQLAEVRRELGMRAFKYPQWVASGALTQKAADERLGRMNAVRDTLERLIAAEKPPELF